MKLTAILEESNYNTTSELYKIVAFGKFGTYKKVEGLIEAVEILRKTSNLNLEIVIAGTDNPDTPGYLESVNKRYSHVNGLTFTGYIPEEDVTKIFNQSAIVVFPYISANRGFGSINQSGSYGKAVVTPDLGDLALLVRDKGNKNEFFSADNPSSLALAIHKILKDNAYRTSLENSDYKAAIAYPTSKISDMYFNTIEGLKEKKASVETTEYRKVMLSTHIETRA